MLEPKRILIATDFSEQSDRAVEDGASLAARLSAQVVVVHVIEENIKQCAVDYMVDYCLADDFVATFERELSKAANERLSSMVRSLSDSHGLRAEYVVRKGDAAEAIVEECTRQNADLLVIGSSGKGGKLRRAVGSTTDAVLRQAPCPVLVTAQR